MKKLCILLLLVLLSVSCSGSSLDLSKAALGYDDVPAGFALERQEQTIETILGGLAGWGSEVLGGATAGYMRLYSKPGQGILPDEIDNRLMLYSAESQAQQAFAGRRQQDDQHEGFPPSDVLGLGDEAYRTQGQGLGEGFDAITFRHGNVLGTVIVWSTEPAMRDKALDYARLVLRRIGSRQ